MASTGWITENGMPPLFAPIVLGAICAVPALVEYTSNAVPPTPSAAELINTLDDGILVVGAAEVTLRRCICDGIVLVVMVTCSLPDICPIT